MLALNDWSVPICNGDKDVTGQWQFFQPNCIPINYHFDVIWKDFLDLVENVRPNHVDFLISSMIRYLIVSKPLVLNSRKRYVDGSNATLILLSFGVRRQRDYYTKSLYAITNFAEIAEQRNQHAHTDREA
jgi:hypothetical protein